MFSYKEDYVEERYLSSWTDEKLDEPPSSFKRITRDVDEMNSREAKEWVDSLKRTGFPFRGALTEYYQRFSFALTPLVVALISCSLGGRF